MLPWNRRRFEEYERFTLGKARIVTNYPVSLVISPEWRPTSRYSAFGGFCNQVMSFWFGSSESRVEVTYKIVIYRWFFDIFKNEPEVIKKVICHELAHIPHFGDVPAHSENFKSYAAAIGAGDFNQEEIGLLKRVDHRIIRVLSLLHMGWILKGR